MDGISWFQIVSLLISIASLFGVGAIMSRVINKKFDKNEKAQQEKEAERQKLLCAQKELEEVHAKEKEEQRLAQIKQVINDELAPIRQQLDEFAEDTVKKNLALQALLKDRLYAVSTKCFERGSVTGEEFKNFESMYQQYHSLGKNGVMDSVRDRFNELPIRDNHTEQK